MTPRRHLAALLLLASTHALAQGPRATCDWSDPGARPYTGPIAAAVDAYTDIPASTRAVLKRRIQARAYDELVDISATRITGRAEYAPDIWDMHWRDGLCRGQADRSRWPAGRVERGLVYCEDGHCILVPTVCRNVARIRRLQAAGDGPIDISPSAGVVGDSGAAGPGWRPQPSAWPAWPSASTEPQAMPGSFAAQAGQAAPAEAPSPLELGPGLRAPAWLTQPLPTPVLPPLPAPVPAVPEPGTWALLLGGLAVLGITRRMRTQP